MFHIVDTDKVIKTGEKLNKERPVMMSMESPSMIPSHSPTGSSGYRGAAASFDYRSSTHLSLRTREGDVVNLSVNHRKSYSESTHTSYSDNGSSVQEFSSVAMAASSYSISIQGSLNQEELRAISSLVEKISPMVRNLLKETGTSGEPGNGLSLELPEAIEEFHLSAEKSFKASFATQEHFDVPKDSRVRDVQALVSAIMDSIFMSIVSGMEEKNRDVFRDYGELLPFLNQKVAELMIPLNFKMDLTPKEKSEESINEPPLGHKIH